VIQIIRPPDGFEIDEPEGVGRLIDSYAVQWPRLPQFWIDIKARLAMTGHREGIAVSKGRLFVEDGDEASGLPRVKVAYSILGATLYINMVALG
jgi:hypothetical protein